MARFNVANGAIPNNPLTPIVDTQGRALGVGIQNVSAVDIFVSDDPKTLQQVGPTGVPIVGWHLPPDTAGITPFILRLCPFNGKLYARCQASGGQIEAITYKFCSDSDSF
jgi:hypothetical protein